MRENTVDRRVGKTRQIIEDALFMLMQEKAYNKITIQDIIDRANVGRSTFYSHYETKDDLLLSCIEQMLEVLNCFILDYLEVKEGKPGLLPVAELFEHIKENSRMTKGLLKAESSDLLFEKVQSLWNHKIEEFLKESQLRNSQPRVPEVIVINHITGTLLQLLKWWVNNKMPYTSSQMDQYFKELINPCIDLLFVKKG